jgi:hypothetical protein
VFTGLSLSFSISFDIQDLDLKDQISFGWDLESRVPCSAICKGKKQGWVSKEEVEVYKQAFSFDPSLMKEGGP